MTSSTTSTVWPWREQKTTVTKLSKRGPWIQCAVMVAVGALFFFVLEHRIAAYVVWSLGALLLSGLLFFDGVLRGFEKTGVLLARGIGTGLTWLLLVPFFYIVFGLGRLVLKLRGADPMRRVIDPECKSYWIPHRKLNIKARYQRQF